MILLNSCVPNLYPYELSVCAIFQNDAEYLEEWIKFHKAQGVDHFWLYNNLSEDNYQEVLQSYIDQDLVTLIEWPHDYQKPEDWNHIQCSAYMDCINLVQKKTKWLMVIDTDEFVFSPQRKPLPLVLKDYIHYPGVGVNWIMYGTSGVDKVPYGLMLKYLVMRAPLEFGAHKHIKSIVQPTWVRDCVNPHFFIYKDNRMAISESYIPVQGPFTREVSVDKLRINHYWSRDRHFFFNQKLKRLWYKDTENAIHVESQLNEVFDPMSNYL